MRKIIYLIRHSVKEKKYNFVDSNDAKQTQNEKIVLSIEGERKAALLSSLDELKDVDEVWCSNYARAIQTAKYVTRDELIINISNAFDEKHYGNFEDGIDKDKFWIDQFINSSLKNKNGESQEEVRNRIDKKINYLLQNSNSNKIAIVAHNECILFYILKYCKLEKAKVRKKLTISYDGNTIIKDDILEAPSIIKLEFNDLNLINLEYININ